MDKELESELVYGDNYKYITTKIIYGDNVNTNFHG